MLSIGGCTKTRVGGLLTPRAVAVTWTDPVPPGVQVLKVASQRPAQAAPLGAMLRMLVLLDWKVKAGAMVVPTTFCADAVKISVPPSCSDALVAGERMTLAGTSDGPGGLCPPHPANMHRAIIETTDAIRSKCHLPMHPPRRAPQGAQDELLRNGSRMNWKSCSVEAGSGIGKHGHFRTDEPEPLRVTCYCLSSSVCGMQNRGLTMFASTCY